MRFVSFLLSIIMLISCSFSAYADMSEFEDTSPQNNVVTEYYYDGFLDSYEIGDIQTSAKPGANIEMAAKSAILMEQSTGTILYEKNSEVKLPLASITKVMSLILIMEHIESGAMNYDSTIVCSEHASSMGGSQIWLEPNEKMSVNDLLKAVVIGSANDATCALAEAVAGSEEAFVDMMNKKAKELGMNNTCFKNCSGLDAEGHYSTAKDIAIMSKKLLEFDKIFEYSTVWMDTLRNGATQLVNTNKLVRFYEGATGLKTGTTNGAGCCVSASAKRDGLHLIAVVMGSNSSDERFRSARKLLDTGFANYQFKELKLKLKSNTVGITKGTKLKLKLEKPQNVELLLEKGKENDVKTYFNIPESVSAPVRSGDTVGRVLIKMDGKIIATADVIAAETVEKMTFITAFARLLNNLFKL